MKRAQQAAPLHKRRSMVGQGPPYKRRVARRSVYAKTEEDGGLGNPPDRRRLCDGEWDLR